MPPIRVGPNEVHATPAGKFQRLTGALPARRGAGQLLNVPGGDPRAKSATGMQLVDGHDGSRQIHQHTAALIGTPRGDGKVDPTSHVAQWTKAHNQVLKEGPRGSGLRTDVGVTKAVQEVDGQFADLVANHVAAMRDAKNQRAADLPEVPPLGSGSLPPPDRAEQLRLVRERVRDDLDQLAEMAALAMRTNDRGLGDELASVIRSNTVAAGARWYKNPAATQAGEIRAALDEWFSTPRTVAGQAAAALGVLQETALVALQNELQRPDVGERLPVLIANGVFRSLMAPDPDVDPADRFAEIAQLAAAPTSMLQLSADGTRLEALDAEASGPVQWGGVDRGSVGT